MSLTLYDLHNAAERPASPYCWRIRESLLLLSIPFESRMLGLVEIGQHFSDTHRTVPVLSDEGKEIGGSWAIAEYLSENHDPQKRLFGGIGGRSLAAFVTSWVDATVLDAVNRMMVRDVHDNLKTEDQAYFRRREEERLGATLEDIQASRESKRQAFQISLHPARRAIKEQPFIGGQHPTYADFALHSTFQWIRATSSFEFLRADDRLNQWIERMDDWLEGQACLSDTQ